MEGSTGMMDAHEAPARRDPGTIRLTQIGLLLAGAGALLMVFDLFGGATVGLVLAVVGTLLAARGALGGPWYPRPASATARPRAGPAPRPTAQELAAALARGATVLSPHRV